MKNAERFLEKISGGLPADGYQVATGYRKTSGWWVAGPVSGENLTGYRLPFSRNIGLFPNRRSPVLFFKAVPDVARICR